MECQNLYTDIVIHTVPIVTNRIVSFLENYVIDQNYLPIETIYYEYLSCQSKSDVSDVVYNINSHLFGLSRKNLMFFRETELYLDNNPSSVFQKFFENQSEYCFLECLYIYHLRNDGNEYRFRKMIQNIGQYFL